MSTTKAIVNVNSDNRVESVKYGPYTSENVIGSNEYIIDVEFFPDNDPLGALFDSSNKSFTYDDAWTTRQSQIYSSEESE